MLVRRWLSTAVKYFMVNIESAVSTHIGELRFNFIIFFLFQTQRLHYKSTLNFLNCCKVTKVTLLIFTKHAATLKSGSIVAKAMFTKNVSL